MTDILLIHKISAYTSYFQERGDFSTRWSSRHPHVQRFVRTHGRHARSLVQVESCLQRAGLKYHKRRRGSRIEFGRYRVVITVGGDGTVLYTAASVRRQILVGVNSDPEWSVGQFCAFNADTFGRAAEALAAGKLPVRKIPRLRLAKKGLPARCNVLNDVLVCHKNPAALSRYILRLRGRTEEQRSSGVWVATAAGSTGAISSAGGRVLPMTSRRAQYMPRELYDGRRGRSRLRGGEFSSTLAVTSLMKDGVVFVDGQHVRVPFPFGEKLTVRPGGDPLLLAVCR